ncbi:MAG TPA: hypothetical protein VLM83_13230 [Anaerolineales bacterium]|nr:hypothetical protein [Anaerolineales bacterium]
MKGKYIISFFLLGILMLFSAFAVAQAPETNPPPPPATEIPPTPDQPAEGAAPPEYSGDQPPPNPPLLPPDTPITDPSSEVIQPAAPTFPSQTLEGQPATGSPESQTLVEPIEAVVLRSWSGCTSDSVIWEDLNINWANYGSIPIHITYDTPGLCSGTITYADLAASGADVLIISNPMGAAFPQVFSAEEIAAIQQYVMEGHHLIGTFLLLKYGGYDNRGLAPLFGLQAVVDYTDSVAITPTYSFLEAASPLFSRLTDPYASVGWPYSQVPVSGVWDASALNGARLVGINADQKAAILSYHGPNYHATYITNMPEYFGGVEDEQLFYNMLTYDVIDAVVVRSYDGCSSSGVIWDSLNATWSSYGSVPVHIRYATPGLCSGTITYEGLVASQADVLILSDPAGGILQYSPSEISAIQQYASEGHNLIGTYLLLQYSTTDNRGLAPLFGLQSGVAYTAAEDILPTYTFLEAGNPLFKHLAAPYASSGYNWSQVPTSGTWSAAALNGARLVGINGDQTAAILAYDAPAYRAVYITSMPEYLGGAADEQFFYNAIHYAIDAVVVRSWSGCTSSNVIWDSLNATSMDYGSYPVHITYDYHGLCDGTITYAALAASQADVLILSNPAMTQSYSAGEIGAIQQYALEGHHLVGTLQLLQAPGGFDDRGLAPLFGLQAGVDYTTSGFITPAYSFLEAGSPLFKGLTDPYVSVGWNDSQVPASGVWDAAALNGARLVGLNADQKAAILSYHGPNYHATFITNMPEYYGGPADHQLFYNMLTYDVVDAVILRSWGGCSSADLIWDSLNATWASYGVTPIHIRYAAPGLCSGTVTYAGLVASQADVLIISDPSGGGVVYTAPEVDAIRQYAQEGHNLIGTYLLFQAGTVDNRILAPLFGCNGSIPWTSVVTTPTYNFLEPVNPVFNGLLEPYVSSGYYESQVPEGLWSIGARLVGISTYGDAGILVYDAPTYRAIFITTMPEYFGGVQDEQFFYNAILYRFQVRLPVILK